MSELVQPSAIPFLLEHAAERWPSCDVSDVYPEGPDVGWERPVIALYEQDSYRLTDVSWSQLVAYRVLAGSREYPDEARRIAREIESFLSQPSVFLVLLSDCAENRSKDVFSITKLINTM